MTRLRQQDLQALMGCARDLSEFCDAATFPNRVIAVLPKVVASDTVSYNEVNLKSKSNNLVIDPRVRFPGIDEAFARHMSEHPSIAYFRRRPNAGAVKISDFLTPGEFHRLGLYNELYRRIGIEHQIALTLPAPPPLMLGIALDRSRRDFSERDRLCLDLLRGHLAQSYQSAQAVTRLQRESVLTRHALEESGHAMIFLTRRGRVRLMTSRARQWLTRYLGPATRSTERLPAPLEDWVRAEAARLAAENYVGRPRQPFVIEGIEGDLVVRLLSEGDGTLLLLEDRRRLPEARALEEFGLTAREAQVLAQLATGKTNDEIGSHLGVSPRTIGKHLERIYVRLGVETRAAAAARAVAAGRLSVDGGLDRSRET